MRRIVSLTAAVLVLAACGTSEMASDELAEAHRVALADTFQTLGEAWAQGLANLDGPAIAMQTANDITYFDNGNIYPSRARVQEIAEGFFSNLERLDGHWQPSQVRVLGPDGGMFWGVFHADEANWNNSEDVPEEDRGQPLWQDGYSWTLVFQRTPQDGWVIVHAHQSPLPPGRIDQYR